MHKASPLLPTLLLAALIGLLPASVWAAVTGEEIYKEVLEGTDIYEDKKLQAYIVELGEEVLAQSEMAGEKFIFTLLDSPDLNAFATRDNYIYVNRGLLNYVSNEAQLVSVLAHEVGHITRNHVRGQEGQATGAKVLSTIAAVLSGSNEVYEAGMAYANSLIKGHGRRNELEADEAGAEYMAKLGYAPSEMISMLSIMKDYESLQSNGQNPGEPPNRPIMVSSPAIRATIADCAQWSPKPMLLKPISAEAMVQSATAA